MCGTETGTVRAGIYGQRASPFSKGTRGVLSGVEGRLRSGIGVPRLSLPKDPPFPPFCLFFRELSGFNGLTSYSLETLLKYCLGVVTTSTVCRHTLAPQSLGPRPTLEPPNTHSLTVYQECRVETSPHRSYDGTKSITFKQLGWIPPPVVSQEKRRSQVLLQVPEDQAIQVVQVDEVVQVQVKVPTVRRIPETPI